MLHRLAETNTELALEFATRLDAEHALYQVGDDMSGGRICEEHGTVTILKGHGIDYTPAGREVAAA
ncbi:MAG: hypothetical protein ABIH21_02435, partial [Patescibacteria group bacterium]